MMMMAEMTMKMPKMVANKMAPVPHPILPATIITILNSTIDRPAKATENECRYRFGPVTRMYI